MSCFSTQYILQTAVDKKKDECGFEGENLRNKNLAVVLEVCQFVHAQSFDRALFCVVLP